MSLTDEVDVETLLRTYSYATAATVGIQCPLIIPMPEEFRRLLYILAEFFSGR